ncbi:MAG: helix-turn-helix transcriptional regulator [Verrucomicrobiales bacterium]|nr:helix-turn-helix transcriptional regulator [Verrucomicrobiales bacterium]
MIYVVNELSEQVEIDALHSGFHEVILRSASEELFTLRIDLLINRLGKSYRRPRFLERVDEVLFENIEYSTFHVEDLAARLHMDRKTLYTRIKRDSGITPQIYIRNIRICRAAHLLKKGVLTVSEVAFQTGFSDVSYFSRCFKAYFRKTPSEFLAKYASE